MPLQGNLGHIGLADVLQTALAGSRGGELVVTRGPERGVLHMSEQGLFLLEPEVLDPEDVLASFAERGQLSPEALKAMRAGKDKSAALLDALMADGSVPETQVLDIVAGVVEDTVLSLLTWREGTFHFQEGVERQARTTLVARVGVDLEGVLLRAASRLDERRVIEQVLGAQAVLFRALEHPLPPSEPEQRLEDVHAALDGRATSDEIALRLGLSRFAALKAVAVLVESGAARTATPDELAGAVTERLAGKRLRVARDLALQWATAHAESPEGARALVRVAEARERPLEVAAALTLLGERLLAAGETEEALRSFQDALSRRPGDQLAQEGVRRAAQAAGDTGLWTSSTLRLAQGLLESDDPTRASALATEVLERTPTEVGARLVRARACVQLKNRDGMLAEAQALVEQLDGKAVRRVEREAAEFCRDAVAMLAPERSDLLRSLRRLFENRPSRGRRAALVSALVAVAATAGVLTWPASPGRLLSRAQEAAEGGDKTEALALIDRIIEEFPESEEAALAFGLQGQIVPPPTRSKPVENPQQKQALKVQAPLFVEALRALPSEAARASLAELEASLGAHAELPPTVLPALGEALARLSTETRGRRDALALTRAGRERIKDDLLALHDLLARAVAARDPLPVEAVRASLPPLQGLVDLAKTEPLRRALRELQSELGLLERVLASNDADIVEVRRMVASLELEQSHAACREQAARLLVAGRLDEADALYVDLETRLAAVAADKDLIPVRDSADRRHIAEFVRERRGQVAEVRKGLEAARAAVESGNLAAGAAAYQALAQRHYTIRFDDLVRLPLEIDSVPTGAEVLLNGKPMGRAPLRLEYPWGGPTTLTVRAPGFEPHVALLQTKEGPPVVALTARLKPTLRWSASLAGNLEASPLDVGGDVLVCDRAGRLTFFAGSDGHVLWTRHLRSLEGARGRPAAVAGAAVVAFLDGRVVTVDLRDGEVLAEHTGARPVGDLAAEAGVVALAVGTPAIVGLKRGAPAWETPLKGHLSAGVLAAHGRFWVGTANGEVLTLDPADGRAATLELSGVTGTVVGLAASPTGVLVTTSEGQVVSLDAAGRARWTARNLGDLIGTAAEAGGRVVAADRRGRILILSAADGSPVAVLDAGRETVHGVLGRGDVVAAALTDGRLWVHDVRALAPVADAPLSPKGLLPPVPLGTGDLAVLTRDGRLLVLPFVAPPPPSAVAVPAPVPAPAPAPVESTK